MKRHTHLKHGFLAGMLVFPFVFSTPGDEVPTSPVVFEAAYCALIPEIDGRLNETVWETAPSYTLSYSKDHDGEPLEGAVIQLAWNEEGLYLAAQIQDSDLLAHSDENQVKHFFFGDVLELFIKPRDDSYYWELYVTPRGKKSTLFFFKSRQGKRFTHPLTEHAFRDLKVGAVIQGTLNNPNQPDKGWTAEMWVPASYMVSFDEPWGPEGHWTIFCGRYNYGKDFNDPELTMAPSLSTSKYDLADEYAELRFLE